MNNNKMTDLFPDPYTSNYDLRLPRKLRLEIGPLQTVLFPPNDFQKQ